MSLKFLAVVFVLYSLIAGCLAQHALISVPQKGFVIDTSKVIDDWASSTEDWAGNISVSKIGGNFAVDLTVVDYHGLQMFAIRSASDQSKHCILGAMPEFMETQFDFVKVLSQRGLRCYPQPMVVNLRTAEYEFDVTPTVDSSKDCKYDFNAGKCQ